MVVVRDPKHLQIAFDLLTTLFDSVGLKTNTLKTEAMVFLPGKIRTGLFKEACRATIDSAERAASRGWQVWCHLCQKEMKLPV